MNIDNQERLIMKPLQNILELDFNLRVNLYYHHQRNKFCFLLLDDSKEKLETILSKIGIRYSMRYSNEQWWWYISESVGMTILTILPFLKEPQKKTRKQTKQKKQHRNPKWRELVLEKDNHTCQCCGLTKKLEAHHIYGYKLHSQYREDSNNGITLCKYCHQRYHTLYGVKEKVNPRTLLNYMKQYSSNQMR